MLVCRRVTPQQYVTSTHAIYTPWWRKTKWSKVPCLRKQHNGWGLNPRHPDLEFEVSTAQPHKPPTKLYPFFPHGGVWSTSNPYPWGKSILQRQNDYKWSGGGGDWYWYFLEPPHLHIAYKKKKRQETTYFIINFITVWCLVRGC